MPTRRKTAEQKADDPKCKKKANRIVNQKLQLIQMVRDYPVLYDKGHPNHLNSDMKGVIWEQNCYRDERKG